MNNGVKLYLILPLCVIICGFWYSSYADEKALIFKEDETAYYSGVKTEEEFLNMLYAENVVNINTADKERLCTLKGIGEKTAQKIIDYRRDNGAFSSIEEIMEVKGIGESTFNDIKDFISVEGEN